MDVINVENVLFNNQKFEKLSKTSYNYSLYVKQLDELRKQSIVPVKMSEFLSEIKNSKYFPIFIDCIKNVKQEFIYKSDIHGINHNIRVCMFAFYLSNILNLDETDTRIIIYGALYHDIGRLNDFEDKEHGYRSAIIIDKLNLALRENDIKILKTIITCHSLPDSEFSVIVQKNNIDDYKRCEMLFKILKDSDGLDRVRLHYPYIKIDLLRLDISKSLVPLAYIFEYNYGSSKMRINKELCRKSYHREFKFRLRKLVDSQINVFFDIEQSKFKLPQHTYNVGDNVVLDVNHFLHGIGRNEKAIDFVAENGIIAKEATGIKAGHAAKFVSGFWRVFEKTYLKDYISNYSGMDVSYEKTGELVPYGELDKFVEKMREVDHWKWLAESPMEIRFMPSLSRDINQYGFILNISSKEAQSLVKNDVNTNKFNKKIKHKFGIDKLNGKGKKNGVFNYIERASYLILGMNKCFIEGIIVGRKVEKDHEKLEYLKSKFPTCYVCNLDGKVIMQ